MELKTINKKFSNTFVTADGSDRAFVEAKKLKTLWFNTGTLCNIECKNCYIESSPKNDRLVYLTFDEVKKFIDETFIELENDITHQYKVLASFKYLEQLILTINIPDEVKNEIPE